MLTQRRQHLPQTHPTALPSPSTTNNFPFDHLSHQLSAQQKLLSDYLQSQQNFASAISVDDTPSAYMPSSAYFNPAIRIQQSTPTPQLPASFPQNNPMLATDATLDNWHAFNNVPGTTQSLQTPLQSHTARTHQRASSSSSVGSVGSQYQPIGSSASYPYVAFSENSPSRSAAVDSRSMFMADAYSRALSNTSNHLPTPTHTPTQDSFINSNSFSTYTPASAGMDSTMAAHMSMKQALMDQHIPDEDVPGFVHSARHSVSSYGHDSPATPHTAQGEDMDFKMPTNGETLHKVDSWIFNQFIAYDDDADMRAMPKFERTFTDVAADYSFDASSVTQTPSIPQNKPAANTLLSPWRSNNNPNDIVQRSLQAAQIARSHSPSSTASRSDSPFRRGSPYRQTTSSFNSPRLAVGSAAAAREQKAEVDAAYAMKTQMPSNDEVQPKTISPKDALLDYREADDESKVPLFPDGGASEYDHQYNGGDQYRNATQSTFDTASGQSYRRDSWATPQFSPNFTGSVSVAGTSQPSSTFAFSAPSMQSNLHNVSFPSPAQYRTATSNMTAAAPDHTPEFPAHLTSMESSASEAGPEPGSQGSQGMQGLERLVKPADSSADSGTYTCTYHGCTQRFETPQKLQRHKREGHRSAATTTPAAMTSAALLERNSQAGPHKCERINPTTGKPCNTIFSRPYDLTRHEDTIHNARKQKVRCALCVEEKTFSRNDALTRHMVSFHSCASSKLRILTAKQRVVHPEIDFPGKHRRRGGNHD